MNWCYRTDSQVFPLTLLSRLTDMNILHSEVQFISSNYLTALLILSGFSRFECILTTCMEKARVLSSKWSSYWSGEKFDFQVFISCILLLTRPWNPMHPFKGAWDWDLWLLDFISSLISVTITPTCLSDCIWKSKNILLCSSLALKAAFKRRRKSLYQFYRWRNWGSAKG